MGTKNKISRTLILFFYFFIILFPSYFLVSPTYWMAFKNNPSFYLLSFIFFLLPIPICIRNPKLNNPFFLLPFSISFVLTTVSFNIETFLRNYLLFLGLIATFFGLLRTKRPFIFLEIQLYLTNFFIDFFEVKNFWRTVIILVCYNFIPFGIFISITFPI